MILTITATMTIIFIIIALLYQVLFEMFIIHHLLIIRYNRVSYMRILLYYNIIIIASIITITTKTH